MMPDGSHTDNDLASSSGSPGVTNGFGQNGTIRMLFWGLAALALGQALQNGDGFLTVPAMVWLTFALLLAGAGALSERWSLPPVSPKVLRAVLVTGLAWQLFQLLTSLPGTQIAPANLPNVWQFQASIAAGGICALLSLMPGGSAPLWLRRGLIAAAFFAVLAAGVWIIRASPEPYIDVYIFQQSSSQALLQGHNPYELTPPNIYGKDAERLYGPELVKDGKLTIGNPYPPLSIYLSTLGYVMGGDIRYSSLVAILITGLLLISLAPSRETLLAAYIFLFTPRLFYVLELSWTEPLVLLLGVFVVWCAIHRPTWKFVALGLLLASKQYLLFAVPVAALLVPAKSPRRNWIAALGLSTGVAAAVTAPLAIWNLPAFLSNVGLAQVYQPFRMDALSYAVVYVRVTRQLPTQLLPFIVLGVSMWLTWHYCKPSPAGFAAALSLGLALFFAFNKQAFCNYYFLVVGMFCCALATMRRPSGLRTTSLEGT
jgi:hypothetical protein